VVSLVKKFPIHGVSQAFLGAHRIRWHGYGWLSSVARLRTGGLCSPCGEGVVGQAEFSGTWLCLPASHWVFGETLSYFTRVIMKRRRKTTPTPGVLLGAALLCATLIGLSFQPGHIEASELGGPERYLAHLSTDKPIYRIGETVYFRTLVLNAFNSIPAEGHDNGQLTIKSPRDATILEQRFQVQDAVGGVRWRVPDDTPGGEYTAQVTFPSSGHAPVERKFEIRAYHTPRLRTQLEFLSKAYGPGDNVRAVLEATRTEGGIPENAKVTAIARIDGYEVWRGETSVDANGRCSVSFDLPEQIEGGVGSLALVIEDGGTVETAAKTLPILLQTIPMSFYPEGGDLVAGLNSGIYVQARTPWGDPADIKAEIVDSEGKRVASIETRHEGRGYTRFTPELGEQYFTRVLEPSGISTLNPLPPVKAEGAVLRATEVDYRHDGIVSMEVAAAKAGTYALALQQRENVIGIRRVELRAGEPQVVELTPADRYHGVLRATLTDADGKPLAERLVFRQPAERLNIEVISSPENAVPGDKVELTVRTTNASGEPVSAVVGLTVTDDSVLQMIETRRQAPRLPAMVLLEHEVDDLKDAHVYLGQEPDAAAHIDLLLGTQGWRRFAYADPAKFMEEHGDTGRRVLAHRIPVDPRRAVGLGGGFGGGRDGELRRARPAGGPMQEAEAGEPQGNDADAPSADLADSERAVDDAADERVAEEPAPDVVEPARRLDRERGEMHRRARMRPQAVLVREYAHSLRPDRQPGDRRDFTETVYWNAGINTGDNGTAKVSFYLSDSVTSFRIMADGVSHTGKLGQADAFVTSRQPFFLEPRMPLEVTAGDTFLLPVSLVNSTSGGMKVVLSAEAGEGIHLPADFSGELELKADERGRLFVPVIVGRANGQVSMTLAGDAGAFSDRVTREIAVRPLGFPISYSVGGVLDGPKAFDITIPESTELSSITTESRVYPSPVANLMAAMERLIREPYG
jgi:alpha-2-macroglobulin-like protein